MVRTRSGWLVAVVALGLSAGACKKKEEKAAGTTENKTTEKAGEISADELERAEKELEKITHDHVERIDTAVGRKEQELLEV